MADPKSLSWVDRMRLAGWPAPIAILVIRFFSKVAYSKGGLAGTMFFNVF